MALVNGCRHDVTEQTAKKNEERLRGEGKDRNVVDVTRGQPLSDALVELPQ